MNIIIYFCVLYFSSAFGALDKNKAGPYNIVIEKLEYCPGHENDEYRFKYKLKKYNRTTLAMDFDIETTSPIDDNMKVTIVADQLTNNGWKENYLKKEFDGQICKTAETMVPHTVHKLFQMAKVNGCPIPPGNYSVKNYPLEINVKALPVFLYNKYKTKITWERDNKRLVCLITHFEFVPKRPRQG